MAGQDPWRTQARRWEQLGTPLLLWRWALEEGVRIQRQVVQGWHDLWVETPRGRSADAPHEEHWAPPHR